MNKNKLKDLLNEIFEKNLGSKLKELERNYEKHSANIELSFNYIEYMKSKIIEKFKRY